MARPLLVDVTRLLTRLQQPAPTGIDRVELAYAQHVLDGSPDRHAVALTPFGGRLLPPAERERLFGTLGSRWGDDRDGGNGPEAPATARLRAWLSQSSPEKPPGPVPGSSALPTAVLGKLGSLRAVRWPDAGRAAPGQAIYLHTSHLRLDRPDRLAWLDARPDISPLFFVHDIIPIEFPEYGVPGEAERHRVRMQTIARRAAAVIANSRDVADRFAGHLRREGLPIPPVTVAPLGIEPAFTRPAVPWKAARPYFVVCSTIEGRKNHLMLLQVWRDLARELGPETPALVIVGRRGWESEAATDLLDRCTAIAPHVVEANGVPTRDLAGLVAGARALLMASFAEGYGIPVVEALAVGTPVIASDIGAHREVAGGRATLLDPLDGPGWRDAIRRAASGAAPAPQPVPVPDWASHFRIVDHVLASLRGSSP